MPYVTIKVTGGTEAPTAGQKAERIKGATDLPARVRSYHEGAAGKDAGKRGRMFRRGPTARRPVRKWEQVALA